MLDCSDEFEIPGNVAYFNCASIGPLMRAARQAGEAALLRRAQPWLIGTPAWIDEAEERRALFAELIGVEAQSVALVPSTSYGFAVATKNLTARPGEFVLVLADEFPSGIYAWRNFARRTGAEILTIERRDGQNWTDAILEKLDARVAIISVPNVHWTDGALVDLEAVARRAREIGARLVVDASQSAGAMPIDLAAVRPDYLMTVGYKWLLGPFGLSYLYVADQHQNGAPLEENWLMREGSEDFARLVDYQDRYRPGARRFDSGHRSAFELTPSAIVVLKRLLAWKNDSLTAALRERTNAIAEEARALGLPITADERGPHMLGLQLPPDSTARAADVFRASNVHLGFRGNAIRISPHVYNTQADIDCLASALRAIQRG